MEDSFSMVEGKEGDSVMIQVFIYLLCALFLYDISSTSDHQALIRSRRLGPRSGETTVACTASWFLLLFFLCSRVGMPVSSAPHYCPALNPAFFIRFVSKVTTDFYLKRFS